MTKGWITAFCFWDSEGKMLYRGRHQWYQAPAVAPLFDASGFHTIDTQQIPASQCRVPVKLDDDGNIIECEMVAGLLGMKVTSSGEDLHNKPGETGLDTISIEPGWWMSAKK